jgi:hypothetical protein
MVVGKPTVQSTDLGGIRSPRRLRELRPSTIPLVTDVYGASRQTSVQP